MLKFRLLRRTQKKEADADATLQVSASESHASQYASQVQEAAGKRFVRQIKNKQEAGCLLIEAGHHLLGDYIDSISLKSVEITLPEYDQMERGF